MSREIIPILNSQGKDEEEAAALMGASGFTIFQKIKEIRVLLRKICPKIVLKKVPKNLPYRL